MWKTVVLLLATLIFIPIIGYYYDTAPNAVQLAVIWQVVSTYLLLAGICFILSTITKNYSQVDKLWSIAPILYAWQIAYFSQWEPRMLLIAGLITLWGIRLTYNFARRGGYSWKFWQGDEDYRWAVLQAKPEFQASWKWVLFNFSFISFYQMGVVLLIVFPMIKSMGSIPLFWGDFLVAGCIIALIVMEFFADQQQYDFQTEKHRRIKTGEPLEKYAHGFTNIGLWKIMRHPNYTAEQSIWFFMYLFSVISTGSIINWSIPGTLLLMILFYGSSNFSEEITATKYPLYKEYQKKVGRFIPFVK